MNYIHQIAEDVPFEEIQGTNITLYEKNQEYHI